MNYQQNLKHDVIPPLLGGTVHEVPSKVAFAGITDKLSVETLDTLQAGSVMTQNYFGNSARLKFFERYRWLARQCQISKSHKHQPLDKIYFEKERPTISKLMSSHGPLLAGDSEFSEIGEELNLKLFDEQMKENVFITRGNELEDDEDDDDEDLLSFNHSLMSGVQSPSPYSDLEQGSLTHINMERSKTDSQFIRSFSRANQTNIRPKTAPMRQNRSPPGLRKERLSARPKSPFNDVLRTSAEKLPIPSALPPKPTSATSGRKVYKFNPSGEVKSTPAVGIGELSRSLTANSLISLPSQSKPLSNQPSTEILGNSLASLSRAKSANPLSKQSSRFTFVRRKSISEKPKYKKRPKTSGTASPSSSINSQKSLNIETSLVPFKGNSLEHDDRSIATGTSNSSDWLLFNEQLNTSQDFTELHVSSPRTKFISHCIDENMNPRASLILRKNLSKRLELQHQGMGDKMAISLAESLRDLPFIESINIADNMLTDIGMGPVILAAVHIPSLAELNLSQNIIGPVSSQALHDYLISPDCPLTSLILNNADVDDFECSGFVDAVKLNKSLRELDLSRNLIGKSENLNTVKGDIITGSEAIADLLRSPECNITKLHLQWNMIRLDGAIDLANSLSINSTLVYLDLSFNSLSTDGGIVLGVSLLKNKTLQTLIISNNSIDSKACFTICAGIIENRTLKKVVLDGNPIGEQGMKALMLVPVLAGHRVKVSAAKCNITIKDPKCWFNFDSVIREYRLNMEDGYERAIALILLHLIAGHQTYTFQKFAFEPKSKKPPASASSARGSSTGKSKDALPVRTKPIDVVQIVMKEDEENFDEKQKSVLNELQRVCKSAADIRMAGKLFNDYDVNGNNSLEIDELLSLLTSIGLQISERRLEELLAKYDADGDGCLEIFEFIMLLRSIHHEAFMRIEEMLYYPIMALSSDKSKPYLPPETGFLHISVADNLVHKKNYRILTSSQRENIMEVIKGTSGNLVIPMIVAAVENLKIRLEEALCLSEIMLKESHDKMEVCRNLIFQIDTTVDASQFLHSLFQNSRVELTRIKREFGMLLRPMLGNPTGYYMLDLSKPSHRKCLNKLSAISASEAARRRDESKLGVGRLGDLSQKGNYSSFRNELFNGKPITMTIAFCSPIPTTGKIEFDFTCSVRPTKDDLPITDDRVIKILTRYYLLEPRDVGVAIQKLFDLKVKGQLNLSCNGLNSYECTMDRMKLISDHIDDFYNHLTLRWHSFEESVEKLSRPVMESHGKVIELFERDRYTVKYSISDDYRKIQEEKDVKAAADNFFLNQISNPLFTLAARRQSVINAKGFRSKNRSLLIGDNDEDTDVSSDSSSDESDLTSLAMTASVDQDTIEGDMLSPEKGENEAKFSEQNSDEKEEGPPAGIKLLPAQSFHSLKIHLGGHDENQPKENEEKLGEQVVPEFLKEELHHLQQHHQHHHQHHNHESDHHHLERIDSDEESEAFSVTKHRPSKTMDWFETVQLLKEQTIKRKKKDIAKQRELMQRQTEYLEGKQKKRLTQQLSKLMEKRKEVMKRRNACCNNYRVIKVTDYEQDFFLKFKNYLDSTSIQPATKAFRLVDVLDDAFATNWIYCRHLALILECFANYGYYKQTKFFGTFRVELVVIFFGRIIDLHNFDFVMAVLSPFEAACVFCRLGYLNIFNPCKPEGAWELDLSRREERIIAKILCCLAIQEPGENWFNEAFRWSKSTEGIPGWELTENWLTDEGLPQRGILSLSYYSGEGKGKRGCRPNVAFRKSLLELVLIKEEDIVDDEERLRPVKGQLPGELTLYKHLDVWDSYLAPPTSSKNQKF